MQCFVLFFCGVVLVRSVFPSLIIQKTDSMDLEVDNAFAVSLRFAYADNQATMQAHHVRSRLVRHDFPFSSELYTFTHAARIKSKEITATVPQRPPTLMYTSPKSFFSVAPHINHWKSQKIVVPDMTDNETVVTLAKMASNAYLDPSKPNWYSLDPSFRMNSSYGMDGDAMRGYVYADPTNSTFIVAVKGTSASFLWGDGGPTAPKDKMQDNLLFSCCCARVDYSWTPVCGCYMQQNFCNQTCLEQVVIPDEMYYNIAMDIVLDIETISPNANVWMTGHSLGGAIAALVGVTFGIPTIAYQAPGDRLPGRRLHLPQPPGLEWREIPVWHVGHTADPIYTGTCVGARSSCYYAGFAMESKCHLGRTCVYDTMGEWGWKSDIRTHRIWDVIERVMSKWEHGVPDCAPQDDCEDCGLWEFVDA